jgi:hypothetical protein
MNLLYELIEDGYGGYDRRELKDYSDVPDFNSLRPETMKGILADIRSLAPAEKYAISFGMHATGWIPTSLGGLTQRSSMQKFKPMLVKDYNVGITRNLGGSMDIGQFTEALGGSQFDFIIFDACLMSSIEALYDLRSVAPYIIVSPAETPLHGFPYDTVVRRIFSDWGNVQSVCEAFMEYYRTNQPYAAISLIKTSQLEELAAATRAVIESGTKPVDLPAIQHYEGLAAHIFYDFGDYI